MTWIIVQSTWNGRDPPYYAPHQSETNNLVVPEKNVLNTHVDQTHNYSHR